MAGSARGRGVVRGRVVVVSVRVRDTGSDDAREHDSRDAVARRRRTQQDDATTDDDTRVVSSRWQPDAADVG